MHEQPGGHAPEAVVAASSAVRSYFVSHLLPPTQRRIRCNLPVVKSAFKLFGCATSYRAADSRNLRSRAAFGALLTLATKVQIQ
jgi:hypothetical protein